MIGQAITPSASFLSRYFLLPVLVTIGVNATALAAEATVPWECSNYTDDAQTRCLNAFIERQQEQIGQLEGRLQAQQEAVGQLKGQIDRQNAATAQLQQQLSQPAPAPTIVSPPYVYPYGYYAYPPLGFGVYLGRPWTGPGYYGYYGPPYGGPRFFYRHHRRHW